MTSVGSNGTNKQFCKPWFVTLLVFFACVAIFAYDVCLRWGVVKPPMSSSLDKPLLSDGGHSGTGYERFVLAGEGRLYWSKVPRIGITATIDVLATGCGCIGLLHVPASVWQMLGGAMIIFASVFSSCTGRKLQRSHWIGIAICSLGVLLISTASILSSDKSSRTEAEVIFGILLILLGQVFQALRMVLESWLLPNVCLPEHHVIGWEGAWGTLLIICLVAPVMYAVPGYDNGHTEDMGDTYVMLANSPKLLAIVLMYFFSCVSYNVAGIGVTGAFSSLQRITLEASRSMIVWAVTLLVHYGIDSQTVFGEALTKYSALQMLGFLLLLLGQVIYADIIRIPHLMGTRPGPEVPGVETENEWASPCAGEAWHTPLSRENSVRSEVL